MDTSTLKTVILYTDGACMGNPGPGGYGVVLKYKEHRKELSGGYRKTTNNRMELLAAIIGLSCLNTKCVVTLYSDSKYLIDGMTKGWAQKWKENGWRLSNKKPALNTDLWEKLLCLSEKHPVKFIWIRGHAGNPENERCDVLATRAASGNNLSIDTQYEKIDSAYSQETT